MSCKWLKILAVLLCAAAGHASAQSPQLTIQYVPSPVANQPFEVRITTTLCDFVDEGFLAPPRFEVQGSVLRLTTVGLRYFPPSCNNPLETLSFNAPGIPAGNYTFEIYYQHPTVMPLVVTFRQSAPLVVGAGVPPVAVSSLNIWASAMLATILFFAALASTASRPPE